MKRMKRLIPALVCLLSLLAFFSGAQNASAYEAITVTIPVNCFTVYGNSTHTYELKLESENESDPQPAEDILKITEDSAGAFEIDLTEPGTYHYSIYEIPGSDANIQYDSSSYKIIVFAENSEDGGLRYTITAYEAGTNSKAERIAFQDNAFSETETTSAATTVTTVTAASTTTASAATTTAATTTEQNTDIVYNILAGDSFPAHAIRIVMLLSAMTAIFAFLFKRNQSEEEEKNE
jgi:pilin isopeptide linkage protein